MSTGLDFLKQQTSWQVLAEGYAGLRGAVQLGSKQSSFWKAEAVTQLELSCEGEEPSKDMIYTVYIYIFICNFQSDWPSLTMI